MNRKNKRNLLITLNWIAAVICLISLCWVDSRSIIPTVIFTTSLGWLILSGLANGLCDQGGEI